MFWRKKKVEPTRVIFPQQEKEPIAVEITHYLPKEFTIKGEITVKHELIVPEIGVLFQGNPTLNVEGAILGSSSQPVASQRVVEKEKSNVDESIRQRRAAAAQKINTILTTKGEQIRAMRAQYWDKHLEADRKGLTKEAYAYKCKVEAIDEVIKGGNSVET